MVFTFSMEATAGNSSELPLSSEVVTVADFGKASKKQSTNRGNNELPSSVYAVMSNDDLLIEILLRLPVMSITMLKLVSKRWLYLITCPNFIRRRSQIPEVDPPSGLLVRGQRGSCLVYFLVPSLDYKVPVCIAPLNNVFTRASTTFIIQQSCNGLLLCCIRPSKFYVYNPSINLFKMLPQPNTSNLNIAPRWRLAFDPIKSPHYKVIHAGRKIDEVGSFIQIETYSSETCNWSVCPDRFPLKSFEGFQDGIYWNDAIHWMCNSVYGLPKHFKLDTVNHPVLTNVRPPIAVDGKDLHHHTLFESRGVLLLLCPDYDDYRHLDIYEMRNGCSEWSKKYHANREIMISFWIDSSNILCIVLGEKDEDWFMVLDLCGKVVLYKPVLNTCCEFFELGSIRPSHSFPFIASFAGV